jgi:hypothetical protein
MGVEGETADTSPTMSLIACPNCRRRIPSSAVSCVHCGALAPACPVCSGSGECPECAGAYPAVVGCDRCAASGRCPDCQGQKRHWPEPPPAASA